MNQLQSFAKECISHYATYDKLDGSYSLDVQDLPDFVQSEFASLFMAHDNAWASEATGPDNKNWSTKMLPALWRYLKDSTNKDEAMEFNRVWRTCVTDYFLFHIQQLLDDCMCEFNTNLYSPSYEHAHYF